MNEPRLAGGYPPTGYTSTNYPSTSYPSTSYSSTSYSSMAPSIGQTNPAVPSRPGDYSTRVNFEANPTAMAPSANPVPNRYPGGYQSPESNYIYGAPPTQQAYSVMDSSRDRMDTAPGQTQWSMQTGSGYPPSGVSSVGSGYPSGRPAYNYSPVGGNPSVPAGYGRAEPSGDYNNPYGPRGAYIHRLSFPLSSPQVRSV